MKKLTTTTQVQAYFKTSKRLMLAEHDDRLWVTDRYLLAPVDEHSLVARLLAEFNLPLEPMVCDVGRTVVRRPNDVVPNVGPLFPEKVSGLKPLQRADVCGYTNVELVPNGGAPFTLWENGAGVPVVLDSAKTAMTELLTVNAEWMGEDDPARPVYRVRRGTVEGLLMPIRNTSAALRRTQAA